MDGDHLKHDHAPLPINLQEHHLIKESSYRA